MKVHEWLTQYDAWSIYDFDRMITDLILETGVFGTANTSDPGVTVLTYKGRKLKVYGQTADAVRGEMESRGLGGTFDPGDVKCFIVGHRLASFLAYLIAEKVSQKSGRGFSFRDNIAIIKGAGE